MHIYTNRLIKESSPYLLQHAHNPVDWYPWNEDAFDKAKKEQKPILVSIGYSACHWCHVMERESFEDPAVAEFMNQHFVNIKVDREERPDVDHIYMDAVQLITGSGGWPLNVFITPDGKPFYGGTYYPPKRAFNRASWLEVLQAISSAYKEKREEIEDQANNLTEHLQNSNAHGRMEGEFVFDKKNMDQAFQNIMQSADKQWGGFGKAPKFPQTFTIRFLLRYAWFTGNKDALAQALLSLDKMIQGGIYDQLGGGFARYSTDTEWLAPHFEKMLYDNALLVGVLSEAFQMTRKKEYKDTIDQTLEFIERELMHKKGGFFSALDADSEGIEGKFYVWDYDEISQLLGRDSILFSNYYNVSKEGNWEGKNILHTKMFLKEFAAQEKLKEEELKKNLYEWKRILLRHRNKRIRPSLDDKLLLSWNALMNTAYCKAYSATGNPHYKEIAISNMHFMLSAFSNGQNKFFHSWKNGKSKHLAFLDDYSFLISSLIDLSEISADNSWLTKAAELADYVIENFSDPGSSLFFYTQVSQTDVLLRKKEVYDSAIPSGNSVMAYNFYRLGILFEKKEWSEKALQMQSSFGEKAIKYPTSFGVWLSSTFQLTFGTDEIALIGPEYLSYLQKLLALYLPHSLLMASPVENEFPLIKGKIINSHTLIYLCKNYACQMPVDSIEEFKKLISSKYFIK